MLYNITFSIYRIHQIFHKKLSYTCLPFSSVKICNLFIAHAMKSITKTSQGFNGNYQQAKKKRKSICRFRTSKKKDLEKISKTFRVKNLKNRKRTGFKSIVFRLRRSNSAESIKLVPQQNVLVLGRPLDLCTYPNLVQTFLSRVTYGVHEPANCSFTPIAQY